MIEVKPVHPKQLKRHGFLDHKVLNYQLAQDLQEAPFELSKLEEKIGMLKIKHHIAPQEK